MKKVTALVTGTLLLVSTVGTVPTALAAERTASLQGSAARLTALKAQVGQVEAALTHANEQLATADRAQLAAQAHVNWLESQFPTWHQDLDGARQRAEASRAEVQEQTEQVKDQQAFIDQGIDPDQLAKDQRTVATLEIAVDQAGTDDGEANPQRADDMAQLATLQASVIKREDAPRALEIARTSLADSQAENDRLEADLLVAQDVARQVDAAHEQLVQANQDQQTARQARDTQRERLARTRTALDTAVKTPTQRVTPDKVAVPINSDQRWEEPSSERSSESSQKPLREPSRRSTPVVKAPRASVTDRSSVPMTDSVPTNGATARVVPGDTAPVRKPTTNTRLPQTDEADPTVAGWIGMAVALLTMGGLIVKKHH